MKTEEFTRQYRRTNGFIAYSYHNVQVTLAVGIPLACPNYNQVNILSSTMIQVWEWTIALQS